MRENKKERALADGLFLSVSAPSTRKKKGMISGSV